MIRELCIENRNALGISEDMKNAGDYELFRMATQNARQAVKGEGTR